MRPQIELPEGYHPNMSEPFMNDYQKEYFRRKLVQWRKDLLLEASMSLEELQADTHYSADLTDRASTETDLSVLLKARDRERKLITKIDEALHKLDTGTYGYCEETGEPIAIARLEARPIATLSVEAQERRERIERTRRNPYG